MPAMTMTLIIAGGLRNYDPSVSVALLIDGGNGDDVISGPSYSPSVQLTIMGGDGNDTISNAGTGGTIDAGTGNDVIHLSASPATTLTLGSGNDQVIVEGWSGSSSGAATITDFAAGAGGDKIDLLAIWNSKLVGWDGSANPFGSGFAQLVQDGADTLLQIDADGAGSASAYQTLLTFQNHNTSDFTIDNFNPAYPTDGSLPAGQTITGTSGTDNLTGTVGGDTIYGLAGNDTIDGSAGADYIDGGADDDVLTGGNGSDVLIGGDGSDQLSDGGSNDVLLGGTGDDNLSLSYSGASQPLTQVADGGEGNNSFNVNNQTNSLLSYQLTGGSGSDYFNINNGGQFAIDAGSGVNNLYLYDSTYDGPTTSGTFSGGDGQDYFNANGYIGNWTVDTGGGADNINFSGVWGGLALQPGSYNFTIHAGDDDIDYCWWFKKL